MIEIPQAKRCPRCGEIKPISEYYIRKSGKDAGKLRPECKKCNYKESRRWITAHPGYHAQRNHERGISQSMICATSCAAYLGNISENVLSSMFGSTARMSHNHPKFDFICGKGFKIDAKSACLKHQENKSSSWNFRIKRNTIADYFICIGFDNRIDLIPVHIWVLPGRLVNHLTSLTISNNPRSLSKWVQYEHPTDKAITICNNIREGARN